MKKKVRSLALDALSEAETSLLLSLGNERMNKIYENAFSVSSLSVLKNEEEEDNKIRRLQSSDDRNTRENWIKRKYAKKEFLQASASVSSLKESPSSVASPSKLVYYSEQLYENVQRGDVVGMALYLAYGASMRWEKEEDEEEDECNNNEKIDATGTKIVRNVVQLGLERRRNREECPEVRGGSTETITMDDA